LKDGFFILKDDFFKKLIRLGEARKIALTEVVIPFWVGFEA